jgi:hypothetical protein
VKRFNHPKRFHISNVVWPGVARQQVTFSCLAKRKVTKEKATPLCRRRQKTWRGKPRLAG